MPRHTGPSPETVRIVRLRDGDRCLLCGAIRADLTTQHRVARGMGGTLRPWINQPANLLTLCGSGTTGCHGWTEHNPERAGALGMRLPNWVTEPGRYPVHCWDGYWWLLDDEGNRERVSDPAGYDPSRDGGWSGPGHYPYMDASWPPNSGRQAG